MKTFAEAIETFTGGTAERPAKNMADARRLASKTARMLTKRYGYLDEEIQNNSLAHQIMWSYVVAYTQHMEQGQPPSDVLMSLAFSVFRHGVVVGIEMERMELTEDEGEGEEDPMRSVFGTGSNKPAPAPAPDYPATPRQIKKLLTMLSVAELIDSWFENRERQWDEDGAIEWVRSTMGIKVKHLSDLTNTQIGKCFEELGE